MRPLTKLEIAAAIVLVILGGIGLHQWEQKQKLLAVAAATQQAQETLQKQLATQLADFDARIKQRDAAYVASTTDLNAKFAEAAKSQAQMAMLLSQIAKLPAPITFTTPLPTKDNPNPQPVASVPQIDFPAVKSYAQECEQCKLNVAKLQADAEDRIKQMQVARTEIDSVKKERDAAVTAAKGGSILQRTGRVIKYVAIGVLVGYVAAKH